MTYSNPEKPEPFPIPAKGLDNKFSIDLYWDGMRVLYLTNRRLYTFQTFAWTSCHRVSIRLKNQYPFAVERDTRRALLIKEKVPICTVSYKSTDSPNKSDGPKA